GSQSALDTITIKTTSDLGEYTPYFMTAGAATNSAAGSSASNIQTSIENFASYDEWKGLLDRVITLWGKDNAEDKAKLDAFSNALAPLFIDAALRSVTIETQTKKNTITANSKIFYVKPWTGDFTYGTAQDTMLVNLQSPDTRIGANKTTLLLSGWQDYTNSTTSNGLPFKKSKSNGVSSNYFEIDDIKWYFNGGGSTDTKLLGLPHPSTGTSDRYESGLAVAIRFLIEAVITNDTMSRSAAVVEQPSTTSGSEGSTDSGTTS
ncbi:hypothetical protein CJJ23_04870, partial [Mycoplasmopsis agassizii]